MGAKACFSAPAQRWVLPGSGWCSENQSVVMVKSLSGFPISIPMYRLWQLQYSMNANYLNSLSGNEGKMMLLAPLKIIFFYTGINDSSKVTLKLVRRCPGWLGEGMLQLRTAVSSCYPASYPSVCQEALSAKVPFLQCWCPFLGSWLHKWTIWRLQSIVFPITLPAGSPCPLTQLATRVALPCIVMCLKSITLIIQEGGLMGVDG